MRRPGFCFFIPYTDLVKRPTSPKLRLNFPFKSISISLDIFEEACAIPSAFIS